MKIKSLILAFPVLCLACNDPSSPSDPASQMEASPLLAKKVAGVNTLSVDFNYDEPCNILGEEYVRQTFSLEEKNRTGGSAYARRLRIRMGWQQSCRFVWWDSALSVCPTRPNTSLIKCFRVNQWQR